MAISQSSSRLSAKSCIPCHNLTRVEASYALGFLPLLLKSDIFSVPTGWSPVMRTKSLRSFSLHPIILAAKSRGQLFPSRETGIFPVQPFLAFLVPHLLQSQVIPSSSGPRSYRSSDSSLTVLL